MRNAIIGYLGMALLIQVVFVSLRFSFRETYFFPLIVRVHTFANLQLVMVVASYFIWVQLKPAINIVSDGVRMETGFMRWRTICLDDIVKAMLLLFLILTHSCFLFYYLWIGDEPHFLAMTSLTAVAMIIHLSVFLLLVAGIHGVCHILLAYNVAPNLARAILGQAMMHRILSVICAFCLVAGGLFVTMSPPSVVRASVPIANLPDAQKDLTIALLTDIHIGPSVGRSRVQQIVEMTNSLRPDIIAISGDLADGFVQNLGGAATPLNGLISRYGSYFVTGNHEYIHGGVDDWLQFLRNLGIIPLHNEHVRIRVNDSFLCVAGIDDLFAERARVPGHKMDYVKALRGCRNNTNDVVILLTHQPNAARLVLNDKNYAKNIDLILSGHTHAGQMYVFVPLVYLLNAFLRGLYYDAETATHIYVSAGVNYFGPPVKMFSTCEIVLLKLLKSA